MKKFAVAIMMVMAMVFGMAMGPEKALAKEPEGAGFTVTYDDARYARLAETFMDNIVWVGENHPDLDIEVIGYGYALTEEGIELYIDYIDETGEEIYQSDIMPYDVANEMAAYMELVRIYAEAGYWEMF